MINFYPNPILLDLNFIRIYWYGLIISLAIFFGFLIFFKLAQQAGFKKDFIFDLSFWLIIWGVIGSRFYHVLSEINFYLNNPLKIFYFWQGGMGIYGSIVAGIIVIFVFSKKYFQRDPLVSKPAGEIIFKKSQVRDLRPAIILFLLDLLAPTLALAQAIGRWGNYFNQELYGLPSKLPWAIPIAFENRVIGFEKFTHFHPTFLYESLWCFFLYVILRKIFVSQKFLEGSRGKSPGFIFLAYIFFYSLGRFLIEFLRIDYQPEFLGLRLGHWVALVVMIISIVLCFILKKSKLYKNIIN